MKLILSALALVALVACSTSPVKDAQTPEQKAFALYGTFVVFEEEGARLVKGTDATDSVKARIRSADAVAKPVADSLFDATLEVLEIRSQIAAGATTNDKLTVAMENLNSWYEKLKPLVDQLTSAVKGR